MVNIWLDCDPGHDDAFALLLATHDARSTLLGVSAVHGNASLSRTYNTTSSLLDALNRPSTRIYRGRWAPIIKQCCVAEDIHGVSGIDGTELLPSPWRHGTQSLGLDDMAQDLETYRDVYLCATGPLTNIAYLVTRYPHIVARSVAKLVIMGGSFDVGGNVTREAEFNVWCDPDALEVILSAPCLLGKIVMCPLDLTHQAILSPGVIENMKHRCRGSKFSQMWIELGTFFSATYRDKFGFMNGGPVHDPTTVVWCLDTSLVTGRQKWVQVDCSDGEKRGKVTVVENDARTNVLVLDRLDVDGFWKILIDAMVRANPESPVND